MSDPLRANFDIGELVRVEDEPNSPYSVRVVVGFEPSGVCLTSYVDPPPWMTQHEAVAFYPVDPERLNRIPPRAGWRREA